MIDFRYHIVSLIAVFLALAIGIVLGAGPLRESIGDQLAQQIEELRGEREDLRSDLGAVQARLDQQNSFLDAAASDLLDGTLAGTAVTVVEMPGAPTGTTETVLDRIEQASGTVTGRVALTSAWVDGDREDDRVAAVETVRASMLPPPATDASTATALGGALAQALAEPDPTDPGLRSPEASTILDALVDADLVTETVAPTGPADTLLVIAPAHGAPDEGATAAAASGLQIQLQTVTALATADPVVFGLRVDDTDLVTAVRADDAAATAVTTVDSADQVAGQVSVPLALAAAAAGTVGQYGLAADATAVLPTPVPPETTEETDSTDSTDLEDPTDAPTETATP